MSAASAGIEARLNAILSGSTTELSAVLAQVPPKSVATALAQSFWQQWCLHAALDEDFVLVLTPLRDALLAIDPAEWVTAPSHPLWELLRLVRDAGAGYQPGLGRAGEKIVADWSRLLQPLQPGDASAPDIVLWSGVLDAAAQQWQQEQQKLARLEQRLIDGERGQLRSRRAQQLAARELNRQMAGHEFTAALSEFLQGEWYRELQWCLVQHGDDSSEWRRRTDLSRRLIASLQSPGVEPEARQQLYELIPGVAAELRVLLHERAPNKTATERTLAAIEAEHIVLLKGGTLAAAPFALIASEDPWAASGVSLSRDLWQRVAALPLGSYHSVRGGNDGAPLRVKLILRMEDSGQLLFVNRLGIRALQKSFEEFAYALATGIAQTLPPTDDSPLLLRAVLTRLLERGEQQALALAELQQRQRIDSERRQAARDKAMAEARALADAQAQAAREAEEKAREQELLRRREQAEGDYRGDDSQRLRQARQQAVTMVIGSWVEFHDAQGTAQRARLAVKLSASGKLIFVDREGVRQVECERDEFAARLLDGSARLLDKGPQFEDTLARVVDSLRRDRAGRE